MPSVSIEDLRKELMAIREDYKDASPRMKRLITLLDGMLLQMKADHDHVVTVDESLIEHELRG